MYVNRKKSALEEELARRPDTYETWDERGQVFEALAVHKESKEQSDD